MELRSLNKDMLIYLICTVKDRYNPENMADEELLNFGKSCIKEIFKRKCNIVKRGLTEKYKEYESVINEISSMSIKPIGHVILSILFKERKLAIRTNVNLGYKIYLITFDNKLLYEYYSGIASIPETSDYHEPRVEENQVYIDFIKFLYRENQITKIINYFDISTSISDIPEF